jgi:hypothetical protein
VVRISLQRLSGPEHLLVSLTITLPPVISQSMIPGAYSAAGLLQSGPRCRTLCAVSQLSKIRVIESFTYALPIFRAVGLNFCTSGCLCAC